MHIQELVRFEIFLIKFSVTRTETLLDIKKSFDLLGFTIEIRN